ncbi:MAG: hypothetical protein ACRCW2_09105 [Cellulosilyticaceae bacterium]
MNKLMKYGMIGAMVLGAQSMVFASGVSGVDQLKSDVITTKGSQVQAIKLAEMNKKIVSEGDSVEGIAVTMSVAATPLTEAQRAEFEKEEQEQIKKICEALGITYKEDMTLAGIYENLTEDQFNLLVEKEVIQVVKAAMTTEAIAAEQK